MRSKKLYTVIYIRLFTQGQFCGKCLFAYQQKEECSPHKLCDYFSTGLHLKAETFLPTTKFPVIRDLSRSWTHSCKWCQMQCACFLIYSVFFKLWGQYPQRISAVSPSQHTLGTSHLPSGHEGTAAVRKKKKDANSDHFGINSIEFALSMGPIYNMSTHVRILTKKGHLA